MRVGIEILRSARLQRACNGILLSRTFRRMHATPNSFAFKKVRRSRMPRPARYKRALLKPNVPNLSR
jgi:hypothetical protein